jgi:L-threonylcarbamoyladenylate synthase
LLRPGPISEGEIVALLGPQQPDAPGAPRIEAPGQLASHYSPGKKVRLDAEVAGEDEFHIGFGAVAGDFSLSPAGDLAEAAARLYSALHQAAASPKTAVAVAPIPGEGLGEAIRDRLRRAAAD